MTADLNADTAWEQWGQQDPYFGVLTNPKFRRGTLDPAGKDEFFVSGQTHVDDVMRTCRAHVDPAFSPRSVLDFGCGVGRLLPAFCRIAPDVVGVDVAASMLAEARRNCDERDAAAVILLKSDDTLSLVDRTFDLVHSSIVLQHIEIERGRRIFEELVKRIAPGGLGAIHVTFALEAHASNYGQVPPPEPPAQAPAPTVGARIRSCMRPALVWLGLREPPRQPPPPPKNPDPDMQMNNYNLSEFLFVLHRHGVWRLHTEITNHGGALGAFLYFRHP